MEKFIRTHYSTSPAWLLVTEDRNRNLHTTALYMLLVLPLSIVGTANSSEKAENLRYFMFSSKPNTSAWQYMIENPGDQQAAVTGAVEKIGGKMPGYYRSINDARNYIILAPPDAETVMAMLIQRLSSGPLDEYTATELLLSADLPGMIERVH